MNNQTVAQTPEAHLARGNALMQSGQAAEAIAAFRAAIIARNAYPDAWYNLGNALSEIGNSHEAAAAYRQAEAIAYIGLGNLFKSQNKPEQAQRLFHLAEQLQPLTRQTAATGKPDFSVLLLTAPSAANTPAYYLIGRSNYDSVSVELRLGVEYDLARLRRNGDVVVNLISDADRGSDILPVASALVDRLGLPVINHPAAILRTGRDTIAQRLAGIKRCRVPKTIRLEESVLAAGSPAIVEGFSWPILVRPAGAHGGDSFEKCADYSAIAAFGEREPAAEYYLTEYVPYESADGLFRKYRFIFINGRIFPYHLAISGQWKVHHFRTEMADHEWMRQEEEAFLNEPDRVFNGKGWDALHAIQSAIGLDYCGIDCALGRNGEIVLFEVNATMLVHGEQSIFAYKEPYIARIKQAFDAMLTQKAQSPPPVD